MNDKLDNLFVDPTKYTVLTTEEWKKLSMILNDHKENIEALRYRIQSLEKQESRRSV